MRSINILLLLFTDSLQCILLSFGLLRFKDGKTFASGAYIEEVLVNRILGRLRYRNNHFARTSLMISLDLHGASDAARREKWWHTEVIKLLRHVFPWYHLYSSTTTRRDIVCVNALGVAYSFTEVCISPCLGLLFLFLDFIAVNIIAKYNWRHYLLLFFLLKVFLSLF